MTQRLPRIAIVVPVFNEEPVLPELFRRLDAVNVDAFRVELHERRFDEAVAALNNFTILNGYYG